MKPEQLRNMRLARAARRAERNSAASPAAASVDLPAIAAKADDLETIKKAVEDAAAVSGGLWLSYLFVLCYIAVAAGAVTHADLLLQNPVKLPFLGIELPLLPFFAVAPFLVLITHAYALLHFIMLGKKASYFHDQLRRQFPDPKSEGDSGAATAKEIRDKLRRLLPSNVFVQILAGPPELRQGVFGLMLKFIALTTLVLFPVLLLLLLQIQFLPYHHLAITNVQRLALVLDIVVLWVLRPPIFSDRSEEDAAGKRFLTRAARALTLAVAGSMSLMAVWLSIVIATIPGERQETALAALNPPVRRVAVDSDGQNEIKLITVRDLLFAGDLNHTTRRRESLFSNTLVLPGFNLYEALKIDDPKKLAWKDHLVDLRGRHLEKAVLDFADLTKADLTDAWLQGASFFDAHLQKAMLQSAQLQDATLDFARLQGASLEKANLQGASLDFAQLQGASLYDAQLQDAYLNMTNLQGATLKNAQLQRAILANTQLQGATLEDAKLQGAVLFLTSLEGASFKGAQLQWAWFAGANIEATDFSNSSLWHALWSVAWPSAVKLEGATWSPVENMQNPSASVPRNNKHTASWWHLMRHYIQDMSDAEMREQLLRGMNMLDCYNRDKPLASCISLTATPPEAQEWQRMLERASVGDEAYEEALATLLWRLLCQNGADTIHILRGVMSIEIPGIGRILPGGGATSSTRLAATGHKTPALVDFIMSKECPVSALLTDSDKERLLNIKQDAEQEVPPAQVPKRKKEE